MGGSEDWARGFFSGHFVDLWLAAMTEGQTVEEVAFLGQELELTEGARILDLACGGGRHCIELADRGYRVTGVDLSREFLAAARASAVEREVTVDWVERAMQDLPWEAEFDGAFCLGNSLGGLDDEGVVEFLRAVLRALKPGAKFVLDTGFLAESILPNLEERDWAPCGDLLYLAHRTYDPVTARLNLEYTFIKDGEVEKKTGFGQVFSYREFLKLVGEVGFEVVATYGSTVREEFQLGSSQLILVGRKAERSKGESK